MKMKKLKYSSIVIIIILVAYNSVYFRKLDEVKNLRAAKEFNAATYADEFWNNKLLPNLNKSIDISQLTEMLSKDASKTFDSYSHALGIGNLRYFLVKGTGVIESVHDDYATILIQKENRKQNITLATEFIFGNAVRDASGLININEFTNTMDFNNVSSEINKIIRETVLPPFKKVIKEGDRIEFVGAIELNKEHLDLSNMEVIPVQLTIKN
jgi:predicted lipoprotein